ncbi:MAG: hypothetical protein JO078_02590 [Candidatus Eremiobacteraeota bacterium]|nr:hypothetical protein [Candidatus Eremiobacteraeota bacterium]MBV9698992.1 hypothetical protein [Candidatus Eremiobacteraeota bacterium]
MNDATQNFAEMQRQWLQSLEAQYQQVNRNLQAFMSTPPGHGSAELGSWATYLSQVEAYFAQYRAMALYLQGLGYDQLNARLQQIVADVHRAGAIYADMYKSALATESNIRTIQQDASKQWFDTMQGIVKSQQDAFDQANARWREAFEK